VELTVLPHRYVESGGAALAVPLGEALAYEWPADAHVTQYAPIPGPASGAMRGAKDAVTEYPLEMVALIGDVDGPGHKTSPEWRAETEAKLRESPFAWYSTSNGYRVVAALDAPFRVDSEPRWEEWRGRYAGFVEECEREYGIALDPSASDPTRIFRLPNVQRESVGPVRATVHGQPPRWTLPAPTTIRTPRAESTTASPEMTAAALAARLPPSVENHGGDQALLSAATELCTVVRGDPDALYQALSGVFNPRCTPPWSEPKLRREAERAAARYNSDLGRKYTDAIADRAAARAMTLDYWGKVVDRSKPPAPLPYVVESLGLAPGKCSAIQGAAGDGKTPFALLLALCVATGEPFLGHAITKRGPVLYLAYEGGPLVEERDARICAGLGIERTDAPIEMIHAQQPLAPDAITTLAQHVEKHAPVMVVVDTYAAALPGGTDANLSLYSEPLRSLGRMSDSTGTLVVALMHHRKNGGGLEAITGHSTVAGALQASIALHRESPDDAPNRVSVSCKRAPRLGFGGFAVDWTDVANPRAPTGMALVAKRVEQPADSAPTPKDTAADRKRYTARRRILAALEQTDGAERRATLVERTGQGGTAANDALASLVEEGAVIEAAGYFSLARRE